MMQVTKKDWRPLTVAGAALVLLFATAIFKKALFGSWYFMNQGPINAMWAAFAGALALGFLAQSRPSLLRWAYGALAVGLALLFFKVAGA